MKLAHGHYTQGPIADMLWDNPHQLQPDHIQLVLCLGDRNLLMETDVADRIRAHFHQAHVVFASTSGQVFGNKVVDGGVSITLVQMDRVPLHTAQTYLHSHGSDFEAGRTLMAQLPQADLRWVMVFSDGHQVNGSEWVRGLNADLPEGVVVSGGLAGDGTLFTQTCVGLNATPSPGLVVAIGFYGPLEVHCASLGGFEPFGLSRTVTKSKANVLYELDGKPALDVYKRYLGDYASELPGSALMFPLALLDDHGQPEVVRTILSIDEKRGAMIFAGDIPVNSRVRLMRANLDQLIDAAELAGHAYLQQAKTPPDWAFLVSCVGRRIILDRRIDEEVEAVAEVFGAHTPLSGFYSYGEVAPLNPRENSILYNQTLTLTGIKEIRA